LEKIFKDEWNRRRPGEKPPETPKGHGYLRRKADTGVFLGGPTTKAAKTPSRKIPVKKAVVSEEKETTEDVMSIEQKDN